MGSDDTILILFWLGTLISGCIVSYYFSSDVLSNIKTVKNLDDKKIILDTGSMKAGIMDSKNELICTNNKLLLKIYYIFFDNIGYLIFFSLVVFISFFCFYKIACVFIILNNNNQQQIIINPNLGDNVNMVENVLNAGVDEAPMLELDTYQQKLELLEHFREIAAELAKILI